MPNHKRKYNRWSRRIERNILTTYHRANQHDREEGLYWYRNAHDSAKTMSVRYEVSTWQACGVMAAISPGLNWGMNLLQAEELIRAWTRKEKIPRLGVYGRRNVLKAEKILQGISPIELFSRETSPKVRSFYFNILDPEGDSVTIDRHAKCLALGATSSRTGFASSDIYGIVRPYEYEYYAWHYRDIAVKRLGLVPNQLQAICWVTWRRLQGDLEKQDLPF